MRFSTPTGHYELNPFPCCAQIVVSNHAFVNPVDRGKGHGHKEHLKRLDHIKALGYDYVMCTVVSTNEAQRRILEKAGWGCLSSFFNRETRNTVLIYGKEIVR